ncbi:MAG: NUDIX domain-containing protein [Candidatus Gracilibacteria bacterium]|nr:NUDIX domain-containing protein [Candidatus Gracilibacteria bacterium]MDD3120386.1 NUDIX domain-containing protein [Candidatus Gracilibacteria bacterium]MDD4530496.1 NUDIX domain-containing protein [Candidatus Gracilibacteria bacterium]
MSRIFERSAGGIVFRQSSEGAEFLLLEWENAKGDVIYVLPKGKIESAETAKDTAIREIGEETGLEEDKLEIIKFLTKINYSFVASYKEDRPAVTKDVYLFLVKYNGILDPTPRKAERFSGFKWLKLNELKGIDIKPDIYSLVKKNMNLFR